MRVPAQEARFHKATGETLAAKFKANHAGKSTCFEGPRFGSAGFAVLHYAGRVEYNTAKFIEKTRDYVVADQLTLLAVRRLIMSLCVCVCVHSLTSASERRRSWRGSSQQAPTPPPRRPVAEAGTPPPRSSLPASRCSSATASRR